MREAQEMHDKRRKTKSFTRNDFDFFHMFLMLVHLDLQSWQLGKRRTTYRRMHEIVCFAARIMSNRNYVNVNQSSNCLEFPFSFFIVCLLILHLFLVSFFFLSRLIWPQHFIGKLIAFHRHFLFSLDFVSIVDFRFLLSSFHRHFCFFSVFSKFLCEAIKIKFVFQRHVKW